MRAYVHTHTHRIMWTYAQFTHTRTHNTTHYVVRCIRLPLWRKHTQCCPFVFARAQCIFYVHDPVRIILTDYSSCIIVTVVRCGSNAMLYVSSDTRNIQFPSVLNLNFMHDSLFMTFYASLNVCIMCYLRSRTYIARQYSRVFPLTRYSRITKDNLCCCTWCVCAVFVFVRSLHRCEHAFTHSHTFTHAFFIRLYILCKWKI